MRLALIVLCVVAVVGGFLLLQTPTVVETEVTGTLRIVPDHSDSAALVLRWDGVIDWTMAQKLAAAFAENRDFYSRFIIDLHSPGGGLSDGEAVIKTIKAMKKTHSVWTYVGPDSECLSMCVPIYMQGSLRVAARTSQWMFHEPVAYDRLSGKETLIYEFEKRQISLEAYNRFFKQSEIDGEWLDRLARQWRGQEIWKTGQELKDENSNIVTVIE